MNYTGTKIYTSVIIVENAYRQGYVVEKGNDKMLHSAEKWAGKDNKKYEYKNGDFKLAIHDAANKSLSQSGKLSFWNCIITAPDGKQFIIGIHSDMLCELLKQSTFISGVCQSRIWLGRKNAQVAAITETMKEFKEAQADLALKELINNKTVKYQPGDLVGTLFKKYIYLGEFNCFDLTKDPSDKYLFDHTDYLILSTKAKKKHLYIYEYYYKQLLIGVKNSGSYYKGIEKDDFRNKKIPFHLYQKNYINNPIEVFHLFISAALEYFKHAAKSRPVGYYPKHDLEQTLEVRKLQETHIPVNVETDIINIANNITVVYSAFQDELHKKCIIRFLD